MDRVNASKFHNLFDYTGNTLDFIPHKTRLFLLGHCITQYKGRTFVINKLQIICEKKQ